MLGLDAEKLYIVKEYIREHQEKINEQIKAQEYYDNKANKDGMNHDFLSLLVDEKVDYLLGKEPTIECKDKAYLEAFKKIFGNEYLYDLQELARQASVKSVGWLQAYVNETGLHFDVIDSEEIVPIWTDKRHRKLSMLVRRYAVEEYTGTHKEIIWKDEVYDEEYVYFYEERGGAWQLDVQKYMDLNIPEEQEAAHFYVNGKGYSMNRVPFIWCKNNKSEKSDLIKVIDQINAYNSNRTDQQELLKEFKNWIAVIKNYVGDDENKKVFKTMVDGRYIFVDENGGVDILTPNIDTTANESHNQTLKDDIILFGQSVDRNKMINGNSASGVALKFLYAGLDLKCNSLESELNKCLNNVEWFVKQYLALIGRSVADDTDITFVFNRDVSINEMDAITMCKESVGVVPDKYILANHPWITDLDKALKLKDQESKSSLEYAKKIVGGGDNATT